MSDGNFDTVIHLTAKKLAVLIFSLQLALPVLVGLDKLRLGVPILRQAVGFVYLTFIPGFVILKILKINGLNKVEELLYSAGLSLSFVMFVGTIINCLYPAFQASKPISETPLIVTISAVILIISCTLLDSVAKYAKAKLIRDILVGRRGKEETRREIKRTLASISSNYAKSYN